jgi:DNA-binding MarR family transcriptional regulator
MSSENSTDSPARERYERLCELSPSAKYVYSTLEEHGTLTQTDLETETLLPIRTVQYALETLRAADLIEERVDVDDARRRSYTANPIERPCEGTGHREADDGQ